MRVVVDTNVLVTAALKQQWMPGWRCFWSSAAAAAQIALNRTAAVRGHRSPLFWLANCDPTDDKFLELAANGHVDVIVSGDGDLLALNPFHEIPIVTPAVFVQSAVQ